MVKTAKKKNRLQKHMRYDTIDINGRICIYMCVCACMCVDVEDNGEKQRDKTGGGERL